MAREAGEEHIALDHSQRTDAYTGLIETRLALLEYARLPKKKAHSPLLFALPTHGSSSHRAGIKGERFTTAGKGS